MAHRPYPNVDRALNQISRHYPDPPATPLSPALQSVHDGFQQMRGSAQRVGAYVLSSRRPGVVSSPS